MGLIDKIKDINEMRKQAKHMEGLLATETVSGKSSGGKIILTMDGNQNIKSVFFPKCVGNFWSNIKGNESGDKTHELGHCHRTKNRMSLS